MTDYANFIRFGENNTLTGNIASGDVTLLLA